MNIKYHKIHQRYIKVFIDYVKVTQDYLYRHFLNRILFLWTLASRVSTLSAVTTKSQLGRAVSFLQHISIIRIVQTTNVHKNVMLTYFPHCYITHLNFNYVLNLIQAGVSLLTRACYSINQFEKINNFLHFGEFPRIIQSVGTVRILKVAACIENMSVIHCLNLLHFLQKTKAHCIAKLKWQLAVNRHTLGTQSAGISTLHGKAQCQRTSELMD